MTSLMESEMNMKHGIACFRYAEWSWIAKDLCRGKYINAVCNFKVADLPKLSWEYTDRCLLLNKFNILVDPLAPILHYFRLFIQSMDEANVPIVKRFKFYETIQKMIVSATSNHSKVPMKASRKPRLRNQRVKSKNT